MSERDVLIGSLNQSVSERDVQIGSLNSVVAEKSQQNSHLNQAVSERDVQIGSLNSVVAEKSQQNSHLNQAVSERDVQIGSLNQAAVDQEGRINELLTSNSWLLSKPFRYLRRKLLSRPGGTVRKYSSDSARQIWRNLPITIQSKTKLKHFTFNYFPILFKYTQAYRSWVSFQLPIARESYSASGKKLAVDSNDQYVPLLKALPLKHKAVKLICFYLPQFHAIPENDEWWGDGFTEWMKVQPAQPEFDGHYQPHIPGELGYYNLLDPAIQHRQVELAKLYGVEGFCFYFYWFGGKRLLEAPIENYLKDATLDLPFCLCWANENWSRRWDGLDSEILMKQQHSDKDDLEFIEYVARYMRDLRYIRINGKPLLLVYRPSLLLSAKETVTRWRKWCMANGIGEIFVAYTQSFEMVDPAVYGFDAAIEFPPNNSSPPDITHSISPLGRDFGSIVYDWRVFVERSDHYKQQAYTLFRSVCPSWDNTPRRKNSGTVFLNSSPVLYQRWLQNAIRDTKIRHINPDEQLIFVNAWNEWGEGAHLEPDQRYGYAYLDATRKALSLSFSDNKSITRICVVFHVFYVDIMEEVLNYLIRWTVPFRIILTTPPEYFREVEHKLSFYNMNAEVKISKNMGRDILPFLDVVSTTDNTGEILLKLHTKRSPHRVDGDIWRRDLLDKLIDPDRALILFNAFKEQSSLGMIVPEGHLLPMSTYWGNNKENVRMLSQKMGMKNSDFSSNLFGAGSMFYVRQEALAPIIKMRLSDLNFEQETGQLDGTLAHAIERCFGLSVCESGYFIASSCRPEVSVSHTSTQYAYAAKSN